MHSCLVAVKYDYYSYYNTYILGFSKLLTSIFSLCALDYRNMQIMIFKILSFQPNPSVFIHVILL